MSRVVTLRSGPGVMDDIRAAVQESEGTEKVLCCSQKLAQYVIYHSGAQDTAQFKAAMGAELLVLGYLEDRRIIVTDPETARKLSGGK